ncbi:MAG: TIGR00282 family metallophosphoesterase [Candidatus Omnitrophica bacterium]|nr:TIGR00282 family metallophosphoesterase [Candidatus Omnitrophota bacterium]
MRVLFLGDIVGSPGRDIIRSLLWDYRKSNKIDTVIANGENSAGGSGLTPDIAKELYGSGIDILTSGDHIWKKKEIYNFLDSTDRLIRPLNYPNGSPGKGSTIIEVENGVKIAVINLVGRVFMEAVECPFRRARREIENLRNETPVIIVDMHAEATSEKVAMGWFLDGAVSAVLGTHTHVQTADEKVLPNGTAYITDCGMTGPFDSVIGRKKEKIIDRFLTQLPTRFEMATDDVQMHGVIIEIDGQTGRALRIERVQAK